VQRSQWSSKFDDTGSRRRPHQLCKAALHNCLAGFASMIERVGAMRKSTPPVLTEAVTPRCRGTMYRVADILDEVMKWTEQ
jgi:hypothetical protein